MGPGGSQEAEFELVAAEPAGTYRLICDGIIIRPVTVTFDLIWRRGTADTVLGTWTQRFEPNADGTFAAQACEKEVTAPAMGFTPGDQLVFRYTGADTTVMMAYIPNGDGERQGGRIPHVLLP